MFSAGYCDHISKGHICITVDREDLTKKLMLIVLLSFYKFKQRLRMSFNFFIYLGQSGSRGDSGAKGLQTRIL
jgi:hypothetical protein